MVLGVPIFKHFRVNTYNWSILTSADIVNYYGCIRNSYPNLEKVIRKSDHTTNFFFAKEKSILMK